MASLRKHLYDVVCLEGEEVLVRRLRLSQLQEERPHERQVDPVEQNRVVPRERLRRALVLVEEKVQRNLPKR